MSVAAAGTSHPRRKLVAPTLRAQDGHVGQWSFSLRRLNLGLCEIVGAAGGYVKVGDCVYYADEEVVLLWILLGAENIFQMRFQRLCRFGVW